MGPSNTSPPGHQMIQGHSLGDNHKIRASEVKTRAPDKKQGYQTCVKVPVGSYWHFGAQHRENEKIVPALQDFWERLQLSLRYVFN